MGIFSLFGKKDRQQAMPAGSNSTHAKRDDTPQMSRTVGKGAPRPSSAKRDAQAALATAMKIDAIESEMSSEFVKTAADTQPGPDAVAHARTRTRAKTNPPAAVDTLPSLDFSMLAGRTMGPTTEFLLEGQTTIDAVARPEAEAAAAVIEEAAILFANNQTASVEQMLLGAIDEDALGSSAIKAWWMLFDLYQITGKQQEFENLSIEYAGKFETSPPAWTPVGPQAEQPAPAPSAATPMVSFSGRLDADSARLLDRVRKLAENHRSLRLEFARVSAVDPAGCELLLDALNRLQKSGHELVLAGARELADKIRAIIEVGRRDETEAPWLLLLEILRLLNLEREFEEASIDYCVTFEVSPPAFVAPDKVTTAVAGQQQADAPAQEAFAMPNVIEGRIDELIIAIASYSDQHDPAVIDCSRLVRIDFNAAGRLMSGLTPFCGSGKTFEFHHVNHLVAALFDVIGINDIARVLPRRY